MRSISSIKIICEYTSAEDDVIDWNEEKFNDVSDTSHDGESQGA